MQKQQKRTEASKVAEAAVLTTLAMIFSYVETLIPFHFGIPGIKLGLANLVALVGLFLLHPLEVFIIQILRVVLTGFLFGNFAAVLYSLSGAIFSFFVMLLMYRLTTISVYGISMAGGAAHNIGQLLVAMLVVENIRLIYYMPVLVISGVLTGLLMGMVSGRIIPVLYKLPRT